MSNEDNFCNSTHELILYRLNGIHESMEKLEKAEEENTIARLKIEGVKGLFRWIGFINIVGMLIGFYLYITK